jgi:hypothetical protein
MVWLHVVAAAVWIGASACVMIAATAIGPESAELKPFVLRVLPAINRLGLFAAVIVFGAGMVRLVRLGAPLGYHFPAKFLYAVGFKIALFGAMAGATTWSYKMRRARLGATSAREIDAGDVATVVKRAALLAGFTVVMGGLAAALGLWVAGSL